MKIKISETKAEEALPIAIPARGMYAVKKPRSEQQRQRIVRDVCVSARIDRVIVSAMLNPTHAHYQALETETRFIFVPVGATDVTKDTLELKCQNGYERDSTQSFMNVNLARHMRRFAGIDDNRDRSVVYFRAYSEDGMIFVDKESVRVVKR